MSETVRVGIIGGGAAGMMAAVSAAEYGAAVTLFEKNRSLGRKLGITGKGRCNVTNNCTPDVFFSSVVSNPRFLYAAAAAFGPQDTMAFFEEAGVELKTERGQRVFPVSDRAATIVNALAERVRAQGCQVIHRPVTALTFDDAGCAVTGVRCGKDAYPFDAVIVCTGGCSYPLTGSTGDGYRFAAAAGHTVIPPTPSLVPLEAAEPYCARMQGLSLKNVTVTVRDTASDKIVYRELGEMMFTHFGVTGPVILSASAHMTAITPGRYVIRIDLKPALDEKMLDDRLLRDFGGNLNRDFSNSLSALLPAKMIPVFVEQSGIPGTKKVHDITKEERRRLIELLKAFPVTVRRARPIEEAIITRGGVSVKEIEPGTMASRLTEGLYFAGEVLDLDAYTGGFNLQIAFSTAYAAGHAAAMTEHRTKEKENPMIGIALDGPSGAGKSTLARALAERLGYLYVDTGALYRAIGLYMDQNGIEPTDEKAVCAALPSVTLDLDHEDGVQKVYLCGKEVGDAIRTPKMSLYASAVSAIPGVRTFLLDLQRSIAARHNVIMDGRDIGTVILPHAQVKIFLTARDEVRARRRYEELIAKGQTVTEEDVLRDMRERDKNDRERAVAPAVAAPDAVILDNSDMTFDEMVDAAEAIVRRKLEVPV